MKNRMIQSIMDYCDELTSNGGELSVTWNGGGDEGYFDLLLENKPLNDNPEMKEAIIDLIAGHLDYGSFAGDFTTEGSVVYVRDTKSFVGTDNYSTSEYANKDCDIQFSVSETLWFDTIAIEIDMLQANVTFIILNGPFSEMHERWASKIKETVEKQLQGEIKDVYCFRSIEDSFRIERKDLCQEGPQLRYTIKEFSYSYDNDENNEIEILLTDKLYEDGKA